MAQRTTRGTLIFIPAVVAPLAAVALYFGTLGNPFEAPDLQRFIFEPNPSALYGADRIWKSPTPDSRPELGAYRPIHATLIKLEYAMARQGGEIRPRVVRTFSVALFALAAFFYAMFVSRIVGVGREGAIWGTAVAVLVFVLHPMATEGVNWAWGQGALLASAGWGAALWVYQLALERRLAWWIAVPLVAAAYFISAGSFEAGFLLPLALLALDVLGRSRREAIGRITPRDSHRKAKREEAEGELEAPPPSASGVFRLAAYGAPLAAVAVFLVVMRWNALGERLGATAVGRDLPDAGGLERVLEGCGLMTMGLARLVFPFGSTFFYSPRYGDGVPGGAIFGLAGLALALIVFILAARKQRTAALGLAFVLIPLFPLIQLAPLSQMFSERLLFFALPGLGLLAGEFVASMVEARRWPSWGTPTAVGVVVLVLAPLTALRNMQWSDSRRLWEVEARRHPANPVPVTYQLIDLVSKRERWTDGAFDSEAIEERAELALELAEPPDADLVYQYLALTRMMSGDRSGMERMIDEAYGAPGPHKAGYFSALGVATYRLGQFALAEPLFRAELEIDPESFDALFLLGQIARSRSRWGDVVNYMRRASDRALPHQEAQVSYLHGLAAANLGQSQDAVFALRKSITLDPTNPQPYITLASLLVDAQQYGAAEQVLKEARNKSIKSTYRDIYAIHVRALEAQGLQARVYDFLNEMVMRHPRDAPFHLYTADYFLGRGRVEQARELYGRVLGQVSGHPDALVGMGKVFASPGEGQDLIQATRLWQSALAAMPNHAEARRMLAQMTPGIIEAAANDVPPAPAANLAH